AGTGELAKDILSYLQAQDRDLWKALNYRIIEKSPALQIRQRQHLQQFTAKILWQDWSEIPENSLIGCCFSNELIDAFPVHLVTINNQSFQEIYVAQKSGKLYEVVGEISAIALQDYFNLININLTATSYPSDYRTEINLAALDWLTTLTSKIKQGYILTIDYGYTAEKYYHPQRDQGTLQCYFQHHCGDNPYQNLGQQDITAHVNFTALENQGKLLGLELLGFTQQGLFLMDLGIGDRLTELSTGKYSLPEIFQRRDALHQLINPTGLGKFGVLIQSKGLSSAQNQQKLRGLSHLFHN
ncbi:MAG: class I SAM-dependent methyltransferase, partial [Microcystaceae cyanobacterium]